MSVDRKLLQLAVSDAASIFKVRDYEDKTGKIRFVVDGTKLTVQAQVMDLKFESVVEDVSCDFESAIIDSGFLPGFLSACNQDKVELKIVDPYLIIKAGKAQVKAPTYVQDTWHELKKPTCEPVLEITSKELERAILFLGKSVRPAKNNIVYESIFMEADDGKCTLAFTDRVRLAVSATEATNDFDYVLIHQDKAEFAAKTCTGTTKVYIDGHLVHFISDTTHVSMPQVNATFPKFRELLKVKTNTTLYVSLKELSSSFKSLIAVSGKDAEAIIETKDKEVSIQTRPNTERQPAMYSDVLPAKVEGVQKKVVVKALDVAIACDTMSGETVQLSFSENDLFVAARDERSWLQLFTVVNQEY